jgi:hypothetical protein
MQPKMIQMRLRLNIGTEVPDAAAMRNAMAEKATVTGRICQSL